MLKRFYLLFFIFLVLFTSQIQAQKNCKLQKPLIVDELKGRVFFKYGIDVFSLRNASVKIESKNSANNRDEKEFLVNSDGRFEVKDLKLGKYYLSVDSFVGSVSNIEIEIVPKNSKLKNNNQIEIVFSEPENNYCQLRVIKSFDERSLPGSGASYEWDDISEITVERTGCYGKCPIEKITLQKDGTAIYIGKMHVSKIGMFRGEFELGFDKLAELFYRQGFFNLKDRYETPMTDLSTTKITVVKNAKSKTVENYGFAAPVELWGMEIVFNSIVKEIKWTPYLPVEGLKNIDLRRIAYVAPKGRIQDTRYNKIRTVEKLIAIGKDSIPFLIEKLDDETEIEHHVMNHWYSVSVGDLSLVILTNFFLDSSWKKSTIPGVRWDEFLERGDDKDSTGEGVLRKYIAKYGRKKIKQRWQKIWDKNKENIYWDYKENNFKLKEVR